MPTESLQMGKTTPNECPGYDIKQSEGEAPILVLLGMWGMPSLPLLPDPK